METLIKDVSDVLCTTHATSEIRCWSAGFTDTAAKITPRMGEVTVTWAEAIDRLDADTERRVL